MRETHRPLTVVAILLSLFMAAMEATVVATAMPTVVTDLGGLELYGWVSAAYMLASVVTIPLYGKLADIHGRKPVMLFGLAVFLVGSMASGLSHTMLQLIAFRAVQGVGAGALQPMALTIVGDIFRTEERARIQGVFGAVWGVAGMVGPLLGGVIVRLVSWRWVFFVNVPFGLLSAAVLAFAFRETVTKRPARLDVLGATLLGASIVSLLLGANRIAVHLTLPGAALLLLAFVAVERRTREPLLPLALLGRRVIAVSSVLGALLGAVMMVTLIYVPLFVQAVLHGSPTDAGGSVAPMLVGWPIASTLSGRLLPRFGFRPLVTCGAAVVMASAIALACTLAARAEPASPWALRAETAGLGVGMGLANTALLIAVQASVAWRERGIATASTMFFRTIGGALAVGALGAVLAAALPSTLAPDVVHHLLGPDAHAPGHALSPETLARVASGIQGGLARVFQAVAVMGVAAMSASLLFPRTTPSPGDGVPPAAAPVDGA
jgi:EmrB/QacA subfamily drug resistance transporter